MSGPKKTTVFGSSSFVELKMLDNVQHDKSLEIASKWYLCMCCSSVLFLYFGHLSRTYKLQNESDEIPLTIYGVNLNYKAKAMQRVAFQMMVLIELLDLGRFFESHLSIIVFVKQLFWDRKFDTRFRYLV